MSASFEIRSLGRLNAVLTTTMLSNVAASQFVFACSGRDFVWTATESERNKIVINFILSRAEYLELGIKNCSYVVSLQGTGQPSKSLPPEGVTPSLQQPNSVSLH